MQPSLFGTIDAQHHASDYNIIQKSNGCDQQESSNKPLSEFSIIRSDQSSIITDIALFTEYNNGGSLFSIHSAPPVPLTDLSNLANRQDDKMLSSNGMNEYDSPRRPASLAIESQQNLSTKTIAAFPLPISEPDEDDNENLLTVSSVTARPLIAKSREIRGNKYILILEIFCYSIFPFFYFFLFILIEIYKIFVSIPFPPQFMFSAFCFLKTLH